MDGQVRCAKGGRGAGSHARNTFFFFQAEDGIRDLTVTGVQTCALPIFGARGRDILLQFLVEAVALSSTGGLLGIALGFGGAKLITLLKQWPTLVLADSIIVAFVFSAAVGIFFGFYPARKASKLDPIDALRYE